MSRQILPILMFFLMLQYFLCEDSEDLNVIHIIHEFQECNVNVFHDKPEGFRGLKLDYPITLPRLHFPPLSSVFKAQKSWNFTKDSLQWNGYVTGRKYLLCTAYLLISPETWNNSRTDRELFMPSIK